MTLPACTVADGGGSPVSTVNGVDVVDDGAVVTIQLVDLSADTWTIAIVGTDDKVATPALTVNYTTFTAQFTKPAGPWALILLSQVNGGKNIDNAYDQTLTTTFGIYCDAPGNLRLFAANERAEGSVSYGWITKMNALIRAVASATSGLFTPHTLNGADLTLTDTTNALVKATNVNGHTLNLPTAPTSGQSVMVCFDDTSLTSGNLTVNGGSNNILAPNGNATTYAVTKNDWGVGTTSGPTIWFTFMGSAWKVG